jgi:Na+/H+ antiporter NhaD/arsenite permease-like protein
MIAGPFRLYPLAGRAVSLWIGGQVTSLQLIQQLIHKAKPNEHRGGLTGALQRIDTPSILFFVGILLAIAALANLGLLRALAAWMDQVIGNVDTITIWCRRR